jgi:hypothetical protein
MGRGSAKREIPVRKCDSSRGFQTPSQYFTLNIDCHTATV